MSVAVNVSHVLAHFDPSFLHPGILTQKERGIKFPKLRKECVMARNVGLMVKLFGFEIVPLIGKSVWKEP